MSTPGRPGLRWSDGARSLYAWLSTNYALPLARRERLRRLADKAARSDRSGCIHRIHVERAWQRLQDTQDTHEETSR